MLRLLRAEFMKLRYSIVFGVLLLIMIIVAFAVSGSSFGDMPEILEGIQYGTSDGKMRGELVFKNSISEQGFTQWMGIVFSALLIGLDFKLRTVNQLVISGNSRLKVMAAKVIKYYVACIIISLMYPFICCIRFGLSWFGTLSFEEIGYVLRCIALRIMADIAFVSIGLIPAFAFRDIFRPLLVMVLFTFGFALALGILRSTGSYDMHDQIISFFPGGNLRTLIYQVQIESTELIKVILVFVSYTAVSLIASYLFFRRAELK